MGFWFRVYRNVGLRVEGLVFRCSGFWVKVQVESVSKAHLCGVTQFKRHIEFVGIVGLRANFMLRKLRCCSRVWELS